MLFQQQLFFADHFTRSTCTGLAADHFLVLSADHFKRSTGLSADHFLVLSADHFTRSTGLSADHFLVLSANGKLKGTSAARRAARRGARSEILGAPRRELRQNETRETPIIMTLSANIKDILSNTPADVANTFIDVL